MTTKVITWQAPNGETINITPAQERIMRSAGFWPRNTSGEEYCSVSHGLHRGTPDLEYINGQWENAE